ncbi:MAG: TetR family transcriptional regulator C-terminal domain-containing protein [Steroidobacteraceae bacterium]
MGSRKKTRSAAARPARARSTRGRQRQRLIDACISALHIYGPSNTTVEKVVAIAKMSPGIVRFYFDSKAAMLVASLQFLAAEFEEQVLVPVANLRSRPVAALERMVDLYLDPDIASPRKVSVWYAFWGEASSRQEYYDICGKKDESFAVLVHELIGRLIEESSQPHLDRDGIALGLIGALEILWQDFAFQSEENIDRQAAKDRCMAYLRSIFPGQFSQAPVRAGGRIEAAAQAQQFADWVYGNAFAFALERERIFRGAWQIVGHESQVPRPGDYLAVDSAAERALLVRDSSGRMHALRNSCPHSPHALVASGGGRFDRAIECRIHDLAFHWDGRREDGNERDGLSVLELRIVGGLLIVRSPDPAGAAAVEPGAWFGGKLPHGLMPAGPVREMAVAADWKVLVEHWLESAPPAAAPNPTVSAVAWSVGQAEPASGWSSQRYRGLAGSAAGGVWHERFIAPNQLLQWRPDGVSIMQVIPTGPGRCRVRRLDYGRGAHGGNARATAYLAARLRPWTRRSALAAAESAQTGMMEFGYCARSRGTVAPAVSWLRRHLIARAPALALERPPVES